MAENKRLREEYECVKRNFDTMREESEQIDLEKKKKLKGIKQKIDELNREKEDYERSIEESKVAIALLRQERLKMSDSHSVSGEHDKHNKREPKDVGVPMARRAQRPRGRINDSRDIYVHAGMMASAIIAIAFVIL